MEILFSFEQFSTSSLALAVAVEFTVLAAVTFLAVEHGRYAAWAACCCSSSPLLPSTCCWFTDWPPGLKTGSGKLGDDGGIWIDFLSRSKFHSGQS